MTYEDGRCTRGTACRYSHAYFNTSRVERLLEDAVSECGYKEFRPILEVEYVARHEGVGQVTCMWRVTLRCVLGYHQKATPQPVVVTSADLNTAMRMLERQFAASAGRPQPAPPPRPSPHSNRSRGASVRPGFTHINRELALTCFTPVLQSNPPRPSNANNTRASSAPNTHARSPPPTQPPPTSPQVPRPNTQGGASHPPPAASGPPPSYQDATRNYTPPASQNAKRRL